MKIFLLQLNPRPPDSKKISIGYRVDVGEHRIFYTVDDEKRLVKVELVGPRQDDEIYRLARRLGLL
jgi:mRNA-degrading endonuclease RelE of RelBE toxin-antitoxin system